MENARWNKLKYPHSKATVIAVEIDVPPPHLLNVTKGPLYNKTYEKANKQIHSNFCS